MEWWSVFRRIRRVVFSFIAIMSLLWAIVLSVYVTRGWSHFTQTQRAIVIFLIAVHAVSALLLYLMIVVVFKKGLELGRMVFLIIIHSGGAVALTIYGSFSCQIFSSVQTCKEVDMIFLAGTWAVTGLLIGYTIYLLIMFRVPRAPSRLTPNLLLSPPSSRPVSAASVYSTDSATRLFSEKTKSPVLAYTPPMELEAQPRTVQKRLFVVNGLPSPIDTPGPSSTPSYGTINPPLMSPMSLNVRPPQRARPPPKHLSPPLNTVHPPPALPPPLPLSNPFLDPLSRHGTPDTAASQFSTRSAASGMSPIYGFAPIVRPGVPAHAHSLAGSSSGSPYTAYSASMRSDSPYSYTPYAAQYTPNMNMNAPAYAMPPYAYGYAPAMPAYAYNPGMSTRPPFHALSPYAHAPPRAGTPQSMHSVAGSVHFHVHHDPIDRTRTASPRVPPRAVADLRRYGSVPGGGTDHGQWEQLVMQAAGRR